jgi:hypothetical protein
LSNTGAVLSSISINGNQLGNDSGGLITYSAANSATLLGISNTSGTANCNLSIQNNDIRGITHTGGTNAHTYIINSFATLSQNISGNTFTNLNVNTTGVIFISNSVALSSTGTQNVSDNKIIGTFAKGGSATASTATLYISAGAFCGFNC